MDWFDIWDKTIGFRSFIQYNRYLTSDLSLLPFQSCNTEASRYIPLDTVF